MADAPDDHDDRARWNAIWRERAALSPPAAFVVEHAALLPAAGRALDLAGGAGRHAVWLARHGLDVTLVDVSDVAVEQAARHAAAAGVADRVHARRLDLSTGALPPGAFDVILTFHYLDRAHRDAWLDRLVPGGVLIAAQPTLTNLERHARPSARFLVAPGELAAWARGRGLDLVVSREGWNREGRHEAEVIARKPDAIGR